jgi:hypothetical protein
MAIQNADDWEQRANKRGGWRPQRRAASERAESDAPAATRYCRDGDGGGPGEEERDKWGCGPYDERCARDDE